MLPFISSHTGRNFSAAKCKFSIIIPVLHETDRINPLIEHLYNQESHENYEIIVVDGDPDGGTINAIHHKEVKSMVSAKGRALQMNAGAAIAEGEILIFLHADTRLPDNALQKISSAMEQKQYVGGAFDLGIDSDRFILKVIAHANSLRSRLTRIPYGDHTIFIRREYFNRIGGYRNMPLMEDVELMRRLKRLGDKIYILSDRVSTSPRRWEEEGTIHRTLRDLAISSLYFIGVPSDKLVRYYRSGQAGYSKTEDGTTDNHR
jgi:rSAM/selenodomain-associated transferase 2